MSNNTKPKQTRITKKERMMLEVMNKRAESFDTLAKASAKFLRDVSSWQIGKGLQSDWNTETAIREGLKKSIWVYACCKMISDDVSSVPFIVEKKVNGKWVADLEHELNSLLERPSLRKTLSSLIRTSEYHLLLGGNAIIRNVLMGSNTEKKPEAMQVLHPGYIKPVPGGYGETIGYEYLRGQDGIPKKITAEEVLHVQYEDPNDPYWGLGKMQVAGRVVTSSISATDWNVSLMTNSVASNFAFILKRFFQNNEEFIQQQNKLSEMYAGAQNAGKAILLDDDADIKDMSKSPKEMDFIKSQEQSMYEICACFGVDPRLIGAKEFSGRAARQEAEQGYWIHTVIPDLNLWVESMTLYYGQFYGSDIRVNYDLTNVEAVQTQMEVKAEIGKNLYDIGTPLTKINERLEMGLELDDVEGSDQPFSGKENSTVTVNNNGSAQRSKRDIEREILWRQKDAARVAWENKLAEEFAKGLKADGAKINEAFLSGRDVTTLSGELQEDWKKRLAAAYEVMIQFFGEKKVDEIVAAAGGRGIYPPCKRAFGSSAGMEDYISKLSDARKLEITDTTLTKVVNIVEEGYAAGESVQEVASRINQQVDDWITPTSAATGEKAPMNGTRALTIARTETAAGIGFADQEARFQVEKEFNWVIEKEWLATQDARTRDSHARMDGERVLNDEQYSNGLNYPGDPNGDPAEIINCRCSETEFVKEKR